MVPCEAGWETAPRTSPVVPRASPPSPPYPTFYFKSNQIPHPRLYSRLLGRHNIYPCFLFRSFFCRLTGHTIARSAYEIKHRPAEQQPAAESRAGDVRNDEDGQDSKSSSTSGAGRVVLHFCDDLPAAAAQLAAQARDRFHPRLPMYHRQYGI